MERHDMGTGLQAKGFTLIEVIVVILIMTVLAAVSFQRTQDIGVMRLRNAAKQATQEIRYAQWLAMTTGTTHGVYFNTAANTYSVFNSTAANVVDNPNSRGRPLTVNLSTDMNYTGVSIISVNFGGAGKPSVKFSSLGTPQDSSGANLTSAGTVILGSGTDRDTVQVLVTTGKAIE